MRAIMVSVDYADLLALTLPYNRQHFDEVWVVTSPGSEDGKVAAACGARVFSTDAFWRGGAEFNKWLALEEGLDAMGRRGWLCQMDADVLWPKWAKVADRGNSFGPALMLTCGQKTLVLTPGTLCSPLRRMWNDWPAIPLGHGSMWRDAGLVPTEYLWTELPIHNNRAEWAGYSQIFHADDPVLGPPPWHDVSWRHAGGADSFFQFKWAAQNKVRPPFEVLHLGPAGQNWYGRATARADGSTRPGDEERRRRVMELWRERKRLRAAGQDQFGAEKLG